MGLSELFMGIQEKEKIIINRGWLGDVTHFKIDLIEIISN